MFQLSFRFHVFNFQFAFTLPKTNIAPGKWWLGNDPFPSGFGLSRVVLGGVRFNFQSLGCFNPPTLQTHRLDRIRLRCSSEAVLEIGSKDRLLDADWKLLKKSMGGLLKP